MKYSIIKEIKRKSENKIITIFDKIPAIIASVFSIFFALSIVLELKKLVQGYVLGFLILFVILFLITNEIVKVKMIKRVFNSIKTAIIPFIITFLLSIGLSSIGVWFWTNKTTEVKQTANLEKVQKINDIKKNYNETILNLNNNKFEDTKEYESLNLNLTYLKTRGTASIEERNLVRNNIYEFQDQIQKQREKFNTNKIREIESLNSLMIDEIEIENTVFTVLHKTSKGMRDMNYQDTGHFERATMPKLPIQPLLVLCGVSRSVFISN